MKKLLGTTLALAMFIPAGANAELLKNFKVSGNLDIQTTSARNTRDFVTRNGHILNAPDNNDRLGHANTRLILKLDWDLLDDVHSRVTLVKGAQGVLVNTARTYGEDPQTVNGIQDTTVLQEANVKIDKVFGHVDVTAGRQFYGEEGDLIIYYGPRDAYGMRVDALDMFRADWNGEHMSVTAIAGKTLDSAVTTVENTTAIVAQDLRGLVVSCKMHEMVKPSVYVYNRVTHATGGLGQTLGNVSAGGNGKNTNLWVTGIKAKVATGGFTGSVEVAKNFGEDRTTFSGVTTGAQSVQFKGYAAQAKAAYKLDLADLGAVTPWGEFGLGTGDSNFDHAGNNNFQSINSDYRPGGIYGRFDSASANALGGVGATLATAGLSNRIIWGVGVKATPAAVEKLTVGAAFYRYAFHRQAPFNVAGHKRSRNIGSEVNVTGEWKHSENVSLKATAGSFKPGAHIADLNAPNAALNPVVLLAGDVSIRF